MKGAIMLRFNRNATCVHVLVLVLVLAMLAGMTGQSRAALGCTTYESGRSYLSDKDKCWDTEINAAFNGTLAGCDNDNDNRVSWTWSHVCTKCRYNMHHGRQATCTDYCVVANEITHNCILTRHMHTCATRLIRHKRSSLQ